MTRPLARRRHPRRAAGLRRGHAERTPVLTARARVADVLARAFGVLAILATVAAAFGGWIATLR